MLSSGASGSWGKEPRATRPDTAAPPPLDPTPAKENRAGSTDRTSLRERGVVGAGGASAEDPESAPARALRARPHARRMHGDRGGRPEPRLLEEPDHRRDDQAARGIGEPIGFALANRRHVPGRPDQHY